MASEEDKAQSVTRIVVRPLGSALPLGFFAFAIGTVLLAAAELKWIPPTETLLLVVILLTYVAPLELLAGIFGFLSRDAGAATAMTIFGAGWIALGLYFLHAGMAARSVTFGMFMVLDSLAILSIAIVSIGGKPLIAIILFLSALRFLLVAAVQFGAGAAIGLASGAVGMLTGLFALYGGLALLMEDVKQRTVLPVFRRSSAKQAMEGSLEEQLTRIAREAGVRQQL